MKRVFTLIILSFFLLSLNFIRAFCQTQNNELSNGPELSAMSAILVDFDTGRVLFEKNSHENFPQLQLQR